MSDVAAIDTLWPGSPYPRGATWDGHGVNFAVFSEHAEKVELCLFDERGHERRRLALRECTDQVWHGYLPQARPGLAYGYRVHGPYRPQDGHRFNPHKLVLDPYAKDYVGTLRWHDALYGYTIGHRREDLSFDRRDSAGHMPKCRVLEGAFSWGDDRRPRVPWNDMVVYETHVRGYTMRHPDVPPSLRGTYAGLSTAPAIDHLRRLGVTTVELMPVHAFPNDRHLAEAGRQNYWGYNTLGFFAPEMRYAASRKVKEFKTMVRALHAAGIEVILDVVYNHSCEGNQLGPTLSMRGIDNAAYYRLADDRRYYHDVTGCGNTLNVEHPRVLQLVMDSLRYWVEEMHVDGFRFDLASALAREGGRVDHLGGFFDAVRQDPTLNMVKLIAEPWDLGDGGYQVGNFPLGWAEWNDRYRDGVRAYWKGDSGRLGEFARRLTGSSDLYGRAGRRPNASVNFVAAHDGFTLHDLVSYNDKHNEANGEDNRDGHNHNLSWNCGAEGPTEDPQVLALRERQKRNLLATLLLSQGVPMLLAGDEAGRTQQGNNNAYAQDNEISWVDWARRPEDEALTDFVADLIALRKAHPSFRRRDFFADHRGDRGHQVRWLRPDGGDMAESHWDEDFARCVGMLIFGDQLVETDARGVRRVDDDFWLMFNAHHEDVRFDLPPWAGAGWRWRLDTAEASTAACTARAPVAGGGAVVVRGRSLVMLMRPRGAEPA
ncbi:glycogen debranching protein GlgX [Piscinibacter sakaiensis]|uniref:Glycogen debranching enzyme n=1 Tax=Piscinibacter sakaiensis TaxID=1547922 RepID=A0A0K8P2R0_PISS1|nr:glycogen debranching protein GlgX [Piscinibacter sakaiensis]GAP36916.1 glycogen debranching enzyme [Piscinibacter sakaiensis]